MIYQDSQIYSLRPVRFACSEEAARTCVRDLFEPYRNEIEDSDFHDTIEWDLKPSEKESGKYECSFSYTGYADINIDDLFAAFIRSCADFSEPIFAHLICDWEDGHSEYLGCCRSKDAITFIDTEKAFSYIADQIRNGSLACDQL